MITNIFLFIIAFISILILVTSIRMKNLLDNLINKKRRNIIIKICLIGSSLFLLFSFFAPYFFTSTVVGKSIITTEETGLIGDTMGGIMNPFIAIGGILLTFLAFYIQYQANKQVQDQFKIQQFESQFYEMLHLHRENLNEMIIEGYIYKYTGNDKSKPAIKDTKQTKNTSGKKVFVTMLNEFEAIYLIATKVFMDGFKKLNITEQNQIKSQLQLERIILHHSYFIFFNGLNLYKKNITKYENADSTGFLKIVLNNFVSELNSKRESHLKTGIKEYHTYYTTGNVLQSNYRAKSLWLSFNYKPFSGHQSILAHYYRHLFQIVKFVVKQNKNIISYEQKRDYLRILRSMLSNHEQILLYYNWLADFGIQWEEKNLEKRKRKNGNFFFTDYRMIHNIPNDLVIEDFKLEKIFNNDYSNYAYEINRKDEDGLFELVDIKSTL